MRSYFATLQELTLPAGAGPGSARTVYGPNVPAELVTFYSGFGYDLFFASVIAYAPDPPGGYYYSVDMYTTIGGNLTRAYGFYDGATVFHLTLDELSGGTTPVRTFGTGGRVLFEGGSELDLAGTLTVEVSGIIQVDAGGALNIDDAANVTVLTPLADTSYTPALLAVTTNPTLGTGSTQLGRWWRDPWTGWIDCQVTIRFGTAGTGAGSGAYLIALPTAVDPQFTGATGLNDIIGHGMLLDSGVATANTIAHLNSANGGPGGVGTVALHFVTPTATGNAAHNLPWAWGANDGMAFHFRYPGV